MKIPHKFLYTSLALLSGALLISAARAAAPDKSDAEFARMDANQDGKVSADEHAAGAKRMFDMMDVNRDGKVTAAEMDAAQERVTGVRAAPGDLAATEKIKAVDTDGDGVLTAEEHAAGSRAMFTRMDANLDGFLSREELAAGHARILKKPAR